jgi:hypothetical protein
VDADVNRSFLLPLGPNLRHDGLKRRPKAILGNLDGDAPESIGPFGASPTLRENGVIERILFGSGQESIGITPYVLEGRKDDGRFELESVGHCIGEAGESISGKPLRRPFPLLYDRRSGFVASFLVLFAWDRTDRSEAVVIPRDTNGENFGHILESIPLDSMQLPLESMRYRGVSVRFPCGWTYRLPW